MKLFRIVSIDDGLPMDGHIFEMGSADDNAWAIALEYLGYALEDCDEEAAEDEDD